MNRNKEKQIQSEVLRDFQKKSPSKIKIENKKFLKRHIENHKNLFNKNLKFPTELFKNKKLLDLGCGTGEVDIVLNSFGAKCYGVDFNNISINRAKYLKKKLNIRNIHFSCNTIENYKIKKNYFDISTSLGVIPHVYNQEGLFKKLVLSTKKNGYIILGYIEDAGFVQRLLHRAIIRKLNKTNEKQIFYLAKKIFPVHINRTVKFGLRSKESIINDYLVNQIYYGLSMNTLNKWEKKYKLEFYSKSPDASLPFRIDPGFSNFELSKKVRSELYAISSLRSIFAQQSDQKVVNEIFGSIKNPISTDINKFVNSISKILQKKNNLSSKLEIAEIKNLRKKILKNISIYNEFLRKYSLNHFDTLSEELIGLLKLISKKKLSYKLLKNQIQFLFKGYNGLGTSYIIYKKK